MKISSSTALGEPEPEPQPNHVKDATENLPNITINNKASVKVCLSGEKGNTERERERRSDAEIVPVPDVLYSVQLYISILT